MKKFVLGTALAFLMFHPSPGSAVATWRMLQLKDPS